jgi:tripartite-type tricarboxylate transporter receptor subunit TctC
MNLAARRIVLRLAQVLLVVSALPGLASAQQQWPTRTPIRAIVPFTVGSSLDIIGRVSLEPVSAAIKQSIVVENRGGAGGTIGAGLVARSDPDGYTLLVHASAHSAAPAAYPNAQYDTAKDFSAIAVFGVVPNVLIISSKKGIKTLKEFVAYAKKGSITYASAGVGSASHWAVERIRIAGGFEGTHVPYKGGPEGILDVSTGRVDIMAPGVSSAMQFIKEGRLFALAVSTPKRSAALPDVPTTSEAGLPNADYNYWNGLLAPARTPRAIIDRLNQEVQKAVALPQVKEKFAQLGVEPMPITPAEFDAMIRKEIDQNIAIVKAANLKFD